MAFFAHHLNHWRNQTGSWVSAKMANVNKLTQQHLAREGWVVGACVTVFVKSVGQLITWILLEDLLLGLSYQNSAAPQSN